jgi:hypothetical protein
MSPMGSLFRLFSTTVDADNRIRTGNSLKIQSASDNTFLCTKLGKEWKEGVRAGGTREQSRGGARTSQSQRNESSNMQGTRNKGKRTGIYNPLSDEEIYNNSNNLIELSK